MGWLGAILCGPLVILLGFNRWVASFDVSSISVFSPHPLYDNFGAEMPRGEAIKALGLDAQFNYMLFFGIVRKYKGLKYLLEALALLRDQGVKTYLVIAGEFWEDNYYDL